MKQGSFKAEWRDGSNRFEGPGELLALATIHDEIASIGGITQDFVDNFGGLPPRLRRTCYINCLP
jgi:hypothetical protein